jgi:hypothetical protein
VGEWISVPPCPPRLLWYSVWEWPIFNLKINSYTIWHAHTLFLKIIKENCSRLLHIIPCMVNWSWNKLSLICVICWYIIRWFCWGFFYSTTGRGVVLVIFLRFLSNIFKKQSRNLCFTPLLFCMNHNDLPTKWIFIKESARWSGIHYYDVAFFNRKWPQQKHYQSFLQTNTNPVSFLRKGFNFLKCRFSFLLML